MGRKSKPALAAPSSIPNDPEGRLNMAMDLKKQGNERFARREFNKALQLYDAAVRLVPDEKKEEAAVLHNNKVRPRRPRPPRPPLRLAGRSPTSPGARPTLSPPLGSCHPPIANPAPLAPAGRVPPQGPALQGHDPRVLQRPGPQP